MELIITVASAVIALASAAIAVRTLQMQRYVSKYSSAYIYLSTAEAMFRDHPRLLELHGIDLDMLEEIGASPDEVVYLINSFTGADLFHRIEGTKRAHLTTYRRALLATPKVRQIWEKIIRGRLISEGAFTDSVDEYYSTHVGLPSGRR